MILIIGAGLSGLLIAYRLKQEGIPFKILEARDRVGGRINTLYTTNEAPIEMGATWFTQQHQHLIALLKELDLAHFEQAMEASVFYEAVPNAPAQLVQIPSQAPSFRIAGGTSKLINTLVQKLDKTELLFNQTVSQITINDNSVQVSANNTFKGDAVVLALPPKLWAKNIAFAPQLPIGLMDIALQTQTWMEDSIKVALTYNQPFWGNENMPGTLFSNQGPIVEFYDQSNYEGTKYALCGFADATLKNLPAEERRQKVITQLITVFGQQAETFTSYEECVWSKENHTFETSETLLNPHQNNGHPIYSTLLFNNQLLIASTEPSPEFAGYMEGAVISANTIADRIMKAQAKQ